VNRSNSCAFVLLSSALSLGLSLTWPQRAHAAEGDQKAADEKDAAKTPEDEKAGDADSATSGSDSKADAGGGTNAALAVGTDSGVSAEGSAPAAKETSDPDAPMEVAPGAARCGGRAVHQGDQPGYDDTSCWDNQLGNESIALHGGLELDIGYAEYTFRDLPTTPLREFLDLRGRFVLGVHLKHEFGKSGYWVGAVGQMVAWARELPDNYQINADDVFGQVGHTGGAFTNWDFQIGRFMTWRVYHKGLGFDLYTLEDCGAESQPGVCGVHTYEVNHIYLRNSPRPIENETAGRAALHYYPVRSLGVELAGVYGQVGSGNDNSVGGRLALDFHKGFGPLLVRASAGGEYRASRPALRTKTQDLNTGEYVGCIDCNFADAKGVGGGAILKAFGIELSGSAARGYEMKHKPTSGANNPERSERLPQDTAEITSFGGYLELDAGKYAFKHPVILGVGAHRTERIQKTDDYQIHTQGAAYVAVPLGFNDAMVKLVFSRAELDNYQRTSPIGAPRLTLRLTQSAMTAGRLRFKYSF
jgi:hypothetical protein